MTADEPPEPEPAAPEDEGVESKEPPAMQVEGAHLLANEARGPLRERGFSDTQIDEWADTYIAEVGSGDVDDFIAWIRERERD